MILIVTNCQNTTFNIWMQGFNTTVKTLREVGQIWNIHNFDAFFF